MTDAQSKNFFRLFRQMALKADKLHPIVQARLFAMLFAFLLYRQQPPDLEWRENRIKDFINDVYFNLNDPDSPLRNLPRRPN